MNLLQLRRRQPRLGIALIALHFIGRAELFQQPEDPLRARVVEVMKRDGILSPALTNPRFENCAAQIEDDDRDLGSVLASRALRLRRDYSPVYPAFSGSLLPS